MKTEKIKSVPELRFPGFAGSWKKSLMGNIASIKHGYPFKGEHFADTGYYIVLTPGNFEIGGGFRFQGAKEKFYIDPGFPKSYILRRGDLLTAMTEQAVGLIGSPLIVPEDDKFLHNQRLGLFQFFKEGGARFIYFFMQTSSSLVAFSNTAAGSKVRHTSPKRIEAIPINIPEHPEQQKIADFLTAVDGRIAQLSRKKTLLEDYKKGVMQQLFTQSLRFKDDDGNEFPEWEEKMLGELLTFKNGFNAEKDQYGTGVKFINVLDVLSPSPISHETIIGRVEIPEKDFPKFKVQYGDLLFQRSSETREEVGQANVYVDKEQPAGFGGFVIRGQPKTIFNSLFMNYLLRSPSARNEITTKCGGSTRYNVSQDTLSEARVVMPSSFSEQTKIANFLTVLDRKIEAVVAQIVYTRTWKKGLLQQMFV